MAALKKKLIRGFNLLSRTCLPDEAFVPEADEVDVEIIRLVRPYTMTTPERILALISAVRYVVNAGHEGAFVECGVWKGGSMMAVAHTLLRLGKTDRKLFLFDTFAGMTAPSEKDGTEFESQAPAAKFKQLQGENGVCHWSYAPLEEAQKNMWSTGYPRNLIEFVKGPVEQTIPANAPEQIALLRLDTDFYESSKHELHHLFPRLVRGGVLVLDDFGHWHGQRVAVEEYFRDNKVNLLLVRVDYTGRVGVKV
jgi:O-methyltransferase